MIEKKCKHCGKIFNAKRNNQKFCSKKCRKAKIKCAECGKKHKRSYKNPNGEYICKSCYNKKYQPNIPLVICAECGKEHKKHYRGRNGTYICQSCYNKGYRPDVPLVICAECGKEHKRYHKNSNGEYICNSCYDKRYRPDVPLVICAECGKEHKRHCKNSDGEYICDSCYRSYAPLVICAECGKEHKRKNKNPNGEYICRSCYYKKCQPLIVCSECGQEHKRNNKNFDGEYICNSCYSIHKCKEIITENMQYYDFKDEDDIDLFLSDAKKKNPHTRIYRQLECELLGYGNYNEVMNQAERRDNYTCQITGKKGNVVVHHLNSYNTHKELACDLDNLISLDVDFHKLYHDTCGRGDNTEEQFWKFVEEYKKGLITLDNFKE